MLKKIAFTMYPVKDMERARNFYEQTLGLTLSKVSVNGAWIEYDLPAGGCFALTTLAESVSPSAHAGGSLAFEVDDIDKLSEQLKTKGVEFKLDVFATPVCKMAVCVDSEGNGFMLHELHQK